MGVVVRVVRVDCVRTQRLENGSCISPVVHIFNACCLSRQLGVFNKTTRAIDKLAGFPGVVRGLAGDQDLSTLIQEQLRGVLQIFGEGKNGFGDAIVRGLTCLVTGTWAVCAAVVFGKGTAVVMSELDDDVVTFLEGVGDRLETALSGVGACAAATDSLV